MGTTAYIIYEKALNHFEYIYVHNDGNIDHTGKMLRQHYATPERVQELMDLGDLSIIEPSTDCPPGHTFENKMPGHCVAYGRDRGDPNCEAEAVSQISEFRCNSIDYMYIYNEQQGWRVLSRDMKRLNWED